MRIAWLVHVVVSSLFLQKHRDRGLVLSSFLSFRVDPLSLRSSRVCQTWRKLPEMEDRLVDKQIAKLTGAVLALGKGKPGDSSSQINQDAGSGSTGQGECISPAVLASVLTTGS